MNPKEVSAGRLTVDPRRDADGDERDHGVTDDGGSRALIKHGTLDRQLFHGSLQKPCKSYYMTQWPNDALLFSYQRVG